MCIYIKENGEIATLITTGEIEAVKNRFSHFDLDRKANFVREILIGDPEERYLDGFESVFGWRPYTKAEFSQLQLLLKNHFNRVVVIRREEGTKNIIVHIQGESTILYVIQDGQHDHKTMTEWVRNEIIRLADKAIGPTLEI